MSLIKKRLNIEQQARLTLERRHAGWLDFVDEYTPYCQANPDDTWAQGQLRYALKEIKRIEKLLGLASSRKDRPAS